MSEDTMQAEINEQADRSDNENPQLIEARKKAKEIRHLEDAKTFDNGFKYSLLIQMRQLKATMQAIGIHYEQPCSDKEVGYDNSHNYHDLGDPCYCGSDNCGICLDCGEENHD